MRSLIAGLRRLTIPWGAPPGTPRVIIAADAGGQPSVLLEASNGAFVKMTADPVSAFIDVRPPDLGIHNITSATFQGQAIAGAPDSVALVVAGPGIDGSSNPAIELVSDATGATKVFVAAGDYIEMNAGTEVKISGGPVVTVQSPTTTFAGDVSVADALTNSGDGYEYVRGLRGSGSTAVGAAATTVATAGTTFVFSNAFPIGTTPDVYVNMTNNAANTATWNARAVNVSNTGFDIRGSGAAPGGAGFTLGFTYLAVVR